jgi:hypothetical protein
MAYQYDQTEDEIVSRLRLFFEVDTVDVIVEPDNDADYKRGIQNPILTVAYSGSSWPIQLSTSEGSQREEVSFLINIQARTRRGALGIFSLKSTMTKALLGWKPTNLDRIYLKKFDPLGRNADNALWFWNLEIAATKLHVQDLPDEDLPGATFVQGTLLNNDDLF